jgi:hypothetical protein
MLRASAAPPSAVLPPPNGIEFERKNASSRVVISGRVGKERAIANRCIAVASGVVVERSRADSRTIVSVVVEQRPKPDGRAEFAGGISIEGLKTGSRVAAAGGVGIERLRTTGRIEVAGVVEGERCHTIGRVLVAGGVFK